MNKSSDTQDGQSKVKPPDSIVVRLRTFSFLLPRRAMLTALALGFFMALIVLGSTIVGSSALTPGQAVLALVGEGAGGGVLLVQEFRLPRIVAGLLAGAALGTAGCLTQTLARNRLATPDLLGVNDGATVAVLVSVLASTTGTFGAWWAGPLGAALAAVLVLLVAGGLGTQGYRILIIGIAMSTMIGAVSGLFLARQDVDTANAIFTWTVGSLIGRGYPAAVPVAVGVALLLPIAMLAGRQLAVLRLDEDVASTLGLNLTLTRLFVLAIAVMLAGLAVGVGGPIGFVALASPVIAGRLAGPARVPVVGSALVGAILVTAADTAGRVVAAPIEIPVGVITSVLGGAFLLWVLLSDNSARGF